VKGKISRRRKTFFKAEFSSIASVHFFGRPKLLNLGIILKCQAHTKRDSDSDSDSDGLFYTERSTLLIVTIDNNKRALYLGPATAKVKLRAARFGVKEQSQLDAHAVVHVVPRCYHLTAKPLSCFLDHLANAQGRVALAIWDDQHGFNIGRFGGPWESAHRVPLVALRHRRKILVLAHLKLKLNFKLKFNLKFSLKSNFRV
jgi:hypothetical protein